MLLLEIIFKNQIICILILFCRAIYCSDHIHNCQTRVSFGDICHTSVIYGLTFNDYDQSQIISYGADGMIFLWDVEKGQSIHQIQGEGAVVYCSCKDDYIYAVYSNGNLKRFDYSNGFIDLNFPLQSKFQYKEVQIIYELQLLIGFDSNINGLIIFNYESKDIKRINIIPQAGYIQSIIMISQEERCAAAAFKTIIYKICLSDTSSIQISEIPFTLIKIRRIYYFADNIALLIVTNQNNQFALTQYDFSSQLFQQNKLILQEQFEQLSDAIYSIQRKQIIYYTDQRVFAINVGQYPFDKEQKLFDSDQQEFISCIEVSNELIIVGTSLGNIYFLNTTTNEKTALKNQVNNRVQNLQLIFGLLYILTTDLNSGISILSLEQYSIQNQLRCFQQTQLQESTSSLLAYDDQSEEMLLFNFNYLERYDTFKDRAVKFIQNPIYTNNSYFQKFVSFDYNVIILITDKNAVMLDRWSFKILAKVNLFGLSHQYSEVYLQQQGLAIFYAQEKCPKNCVLAANLVKKRFFTLKNIPYSSKIIYDQDNNWLVSLGYSDCYITFFKINEQSEKWELIKQIKEQDCKKMIGNLNLKRKILYIYFERSYMGTHQVLLYPDLVPINQFFSQQIQPCKTSTQYLLQQNDIIVSICSGNMQLIDFEMDIVLEINSGECNFDIQMEINELFYFNTCNILYIVDFSQNGSYRKVQLKSTLSQIAIDQESQQLYITQISGDLTYSTFDLTQISTIPISNEIQHIFLPEDSEKMYLERSLHKNQKSELGVFFRNQVFIETNRTVDTQYSVIYDIVWIDIREQFAVLTEQGLSFFSVYLNEVSFFGNCNQTQSSFIKIQYIPDQNYIILYQNQLCIVSLEKMEQLTIDIQQELNHQDLFIQKFYYHNQKNWFMLELSDNNNSWLQLYSILDLQKINSFDYQQKGLISLLCFDFRNDTLIFVNQADNFYRIIVMNIEFNTVAEIISTQTDYYYNSFIIADQYIALATQMGMIEIVETKSYQIVYSQKYFSNRVTKLKYYSQDSTLFTCSNDQYCRYETLNLEVLESQLIYKKHICLINDIHIFRNLNLFIVGCFQILEQDNSFIKIYQLSTGNIMRSISTQFQLRVQYQIPLWNSVIFIDSSFAVIQINQNQFKAQKEYLQIIQVDISTLYSNIEFHYNQERIDYFFPTVFKNPIQDYYLIPSKDSKLYLYDNVQEKLSIAYIFNENILQMEWEQDSYSDQDQNGSGQTDYVFISTQNSIIKFNYQKLNNEIQMQIESSQFIQIESYLVLINQPSIVIQLLSNDLSYIQEIDIHHPIENFIYLNENNYILFYHYNGFITIFDSINFQILLQEQLFQKRIQGITFNQFDKTLFIFSRKGYFLIYQIQQDYTSLILIQEQQFQESIANIILISDSKFLVSFVNSRFIYIYSYSNNGLNNNNNMTYIGVLIMPFRQIKYQLKLINELNQLLAYCSFTFTIFDLDTFKTIFYFKEDQTDNPIMEVLHLEGDKFLISNMLDLIIIQIMNHRVKKDRMFYDQNYYNSYDKDFITLSYQKTNQRFKVFNFTITLVQSLSKIYKNINLIGFQNSSLVIYNLIMDEKYEKQSNLTCQIQLDNPSFFQIKNTFQNLQTLNSQYFHNYDIIINISDFFEYYSPLPQLSEQINSKLIFSGKKLENNYLHIFELKQYIFNENNFNSIVFENFQIEISEQISIDKSQLKQLSFINCSITLSQNFKQDISANNQNGPQTIVFLSGIEIFQLIQVILCNLDHESLIFFKIQNFQNILIEGFEYYNNSNKNFKLIHIFQGNSFQFINGTISQNHLIDHTSLFLVQQVQDVTIYKLDIVDNHSEIKEFKKAITFELNNIKNANIQQVFYAFNKNIQLLSYSKMGDYFQQEEIEILITVNVNLIVQNITIQDNLNDFYQIASFNNGDNMQLLNIVVNNNQGVDCLIQLLNIHSAQFTNLVVSNNISKSSLQLLSVDICNINKSLFINNLSTLNGAAILANSSTVREIHILNSQFINNTALYSGGAIYLTNQEAFLVNNQFINNTALIGGAIRYSQFKPSSVIVKGVIQRNKFVINQGILFGQNVGSDPLIAAIKSRITLDKFEIKDFQSGKQIEELLIYILDEEQNVVSLKYDEYFYKIQQKIISKSKIDKNLFQKIINNTKNLVMQYIENFVLEITPAEQNETIQLSNKTKFYYDIKQSYFNLQGLTMYGIPNKSSLIKITIPPLQDYSDYNFQSSQKPFIIPVSFRTCQRGEVYVKRSDQIYSCQDCQNNRYSLEQPKLFDTSIQCKQCSQENTLSCEKDQIIIRPGYWRSYEQDDQIFYCENSPENCYGSSTSQCSEGYIGPLCEACDSYGIIWNKSYGRVGQYQCSECTSNNIILLKVFLTILVVCLYFYYTVKKTLEKSQKKAAAVVLRRLNILMICNSGSPNELVYSLQKMLLNFIQITTVFQTSLLFKQINFLSFLFFIGDPSQLTSTSLDCILSQQKVIKIHYLRALIYLTMPFFYLIVSFILYLIMINLFKMKYSKTFLYISYNQGILFFQSGVIKAAIGIIACRKIGNNLWIQSQVNEICYTHEHIQILCLYLIPIALIVVFVFPLIVFKQMWQRRFSLNEPAFIIKYGVFFIDYKEKCYYWEFIRFFFRVILSLVGNIFDYKSNTIKYNLSAMTLILYYLLIQKMNPYLLIKMNRYDKRITLVTIALFLIQNIISTDKSSLVLFFQVLHFLLIIFVYLFFFYKIFFEIISKCSCCQTLSNIPFLNRIFKNNRNPSLKVFILWKRLKKEYFKAYQNMMQADALYQRMMSQTNLGHLSVLDKTKQNMSDQIHTQKQMFSNTLSSQPSASFGITNVSKKNKQFKLNLIAIQQD